MARSKSARALTTTFLDYLPVDAILAAFAKAPGNELESGKLDSPESSAALAANTFGLFVQRAELLPPLPKLGDVGWPPITVGLEQCARFPWRGGKHPWLDVIVETRSHLIGIESKRYEPFRDKQASSFSAAYSRPVWGRRMGPFQRGMNRLTDGSLNYRHLNAGQLVKHAFGLRTEALRRKKKPALLYLFAEPKAWPDGRLIAPSARRAHALEIADFTQAVSGAEVMFRSCSYRDLLQSFAASPELEVRQHAMAVKAKFRG